MPFPKQYSDIYGTVIAKARLDANLTADVTRAKDWVNLAYADVALTSKFWEGSAATAALAAAVTADTLPTALIELEDVTCSYAGTFPPMREVTWEQLLNLRAYSSTGRGPPQVYSLRKNSLEFWPAAQGGEILTYYGSKQPAAWLSDDTDVPDIPEPFSQLLEYGALVQAGEYKNDLLMLGEYQQSYGAMMGKFLKFCQARMGTDARSFPVRLGRSNLLPHDPSSDWYVVSGVAYS